MKVQTGGDHDDRRGVFIPAEVLVTAAIVLVGLALAALAAVFPPVGSPVSVGVGVGGFLYGIYHDRRRPPGRPPTELPAGLPNGFAEAERPDIGAGGG
ncbi:hypothetical protein ETD83_18005 [Actinomadura soli]|uniref:Uncharacterized protein n=1 Tax=Actinomadura soli TaxID=2508997 RepID=A0A5C4JBQ8_9ACTN|nr:hypothetical protein [Actinomadura soli]TMQ99247.1 hypothetical protein ETD83_18005 [Actinomadura soli]